MKAFDGEALDEAVRAARNFLNELPQRRVYPSEQAIEIIERYDPPLPAEETKPSQVIAELAELGGYGTVASSGPRYFGYVIGGVVPAALAANWLAGAWDQVSTDYRLSPLTVRLEEVTGRWLLELLGLPAGAAVNYVTGSTMAGFIGLAAARSEIFRRQGWDVQARGLNGAPPIRIIASAETHPTMFKALGMLGLGTETSVRVPVDDQGRLRVAAMPELGEDCIVIAQAGNVNSGSFDPLDAICERAEAAGAWVHVDGAFGLLAAASPPHAPLLSGHDRADSWNIDGHKWLNTPYDCGIAICRHPGALRRAFANNAAYLGDNMRDPRDMVPELSRRARSIEMWAVLRSLGRKGVEHLVRRNCAQAQRFGEGLTRLGFDVLNDIVLNQCVAKYGSAERTRAIAALVQQSGKAWFSTTYWQGQTAIRINCTSWLTTDEDVDLTLGVIAEAVEQTKSGGNADRI